MDNKLSENIQEIRKGRLIHRGSHEIIESEIDIRRENVNRDKNPEKLLSLLFVIVMLSLNYILKKCNGEYKFTKSEEKVNHMDDIKMFAEK